MSAAMISANINYSVDTGVKPVSESYGPGNIHYRSTASYELRTVNIRDGRPLADSFSLDQNGFELVAHPTAVTDFFDAEELKCVYYPEIEALIGRVAGAARVVAFDHTLRSGDKIEREARLVREPVLSAHNDYTERSAPRRVREFLPDEADALLARRFAIIQVWRAIDRPIQSMPLAVIDSRSIAPDDLIATERRYPNRVGEIYNLRYNPAHRWFYFPQMRRNEALVFKVYDSAEDGRARLTPHTAFKDPTTPADAPPRQSIEVRTFAFFD
jgi:hypothetical protein